MRPCSLVLLPGLDGTGEMFAPLLAELPAWVRPVVVPYPRDRPLGYEGLLPLAARALPPDGPFVILGESFGGPLAVLLAAGRPRGLLGVILCASFVTKPLRMLPAWASALCVGPLFRLWPPLLRLRSLGRRREFGGLLDTALAAIRSVRPGVVGARVRALLRVNVEEQLRAMDRPLLYLQAGRDLVVRAHNLERVRQLRPDVRVVRVDTLHFLLQLEPKRCAAEIAAFLESLPPPP